MRVCHRCVRILLSCIRFQVRVRRPRPQQQPLSRRPPNNSDKQRGQHRGPRGRWSSNRSLPGLLSRPPRADDDLRLRRCLLVGTHCDPGQQAAPPSAARSYASTLPPSSSSSSLSSSSSSASCPPSFLRRPDDPPPVRMQPHRGQLSPTPESI
jgi:hypothetical protein